MLKKIRASLVLPSETAYPDIDNAHNVLTASDDLLIDFAKVFTQQNGNFFYCENEISLAESFLALCENHNWNELSFCDIPTNALLKYFEFPGVQIDFKSNLKYCFVQKCDALLVGGELIFRNAFAPVKQALSITDNIILIIDASRIFQRLGEAMDYLAKEKTVQSNGLYITTAHAMCRPYTYNELNQKIAEKNIHLFVAENLDNALSLEK